MTKPTIIAGPAIIIWDSAITYTEGDIVLDVSPTVFELPTAVHGNQSARLDVNVVTVKYTPSGQWNAAVQSSYFRYLNTQLGTNLLAGVSDCVIWTLSGKKYQVADMWLPNMPNLRFAPTKTMVGEVSLEAYSISGTPVTESTAAFTDANFDPDDDHLTLPYTAAWGTTAPWDLIQVNEEGFEVSFSMEVGDHISAEYGPIGKTLKSLTAEITCTPFGVDATALAALVAPSTCSRGKPIGNSNTFTISGPAVGDPQLILNAVRPTLAPSQFSAEANRAGQITWACRRGLLAGATQPLGTIGTVAA